MWKQVGSGLRASIANIAEEAVATVAELREAHNPQNWEQKPQPAVEKDEDHGGSGADFHSSSGNSGHNGVLLQDKASSSMQEEEQQKQAKNASDSFSEPPKEPGFPLNEYKVQSSNGMNSKQAHDEGKKDDLAARLAAIKARIGSERVHWDTGGQGIKAAEEDQSTNSGLKFQSTSNVVTNSSSINDHVVENECTQERSESEHSHRHYAEAQAKSADVVKRLTDTQNELIQSRKNFQSIETQLQDQTKQTEHYKELASEFEETIRTLETKLKAEEAKCASLESTLSEEKQFRLNVENNIEDSIQQSSKQKESEKELDILQKDFLELKRFHQDVIEERDSLKQQLSRLKAQMLSEQEDEEEKIKWQVDAEVKLALEKASLQRKALEGSDNQLSELRAEVEAARVRATRAENEAARWEQIASSRDVELENMQRALGDLSFESDAAERLRGELRAKQVEIHQLKKAMDDLTDKMTKQEDIEKSLQKELTSLRDLARSARDAEALARKEALEALSSLDITKKELARFKNTGDVFEKESVVKALVQTASQGRSGKKIAYSIAELLQLSTSDLDAAIKNSIESKPEDERKKPESLSLAFAEFLEKELESDK